ncbi:MAG: hypothetical protein KF753_16710 [Caldilineaceae bacterium]|nr:hypothetical protein [Caldilineaceae bacterium]
MLRRFRLWHLFVILLSVLVLSVGLLRAASTDAVIGDGTPASCTEAAFDAALNSGGAITFNCGGAPLVIPLSAQKVISGDTQIDGGGLITLHANGSRHFYIPAGGKLTLRNITLSDGFANGDGGSIFNQSVVEIDNATLQNNATSMSFSGGAIVNYGSLTITNSTLQDNTGGNGGAVYPRWPGSRTRIVNSILRRNHAANATGWGGALLTWDGAVVVIENSLLAGNTAIEGGAIYNTSNSDVTVTGSTLRQNQASQWGGAIVNNQHMRILNSIIAENTGQYQGGGIVNQGGVIEIESSSVSANAITGADGTGGNILNYYQGVGNDIHYGSLSLTASTVAAGNAPFLGGGIFTYGPVTITASSLISNTTAGRGGGMYIDASANGSVIIVNSTLAANHAGGHGGAIYKASGALNLRFSTLAGNSSGQEGNALYMDLGQQQSTTAAGVILSGDCVQNGVVSQGYNLDSGTSCGFNQATDLTNTDPLLGPLADNGGPTLTQKPAPGSPAIDAVLGGDCPAQDQRGQPRPFGPRCDIGAVEVGDQPVNTPTSTPTPTATATPTATSTPTQVPTPNTLNYTAYTLEVTQGIQDLSNTVPLIRGKTAWVRFYVGRSAGQSSPLVSAQLWHIVNNQRVGSPVYPSNPGGKLAPPTSPNRGQLGDTFYFPVPSDWLNASTLQVEATANPSKATGGCGILCFFFWWRDADETNYSDNTVRSPLLALQSVPVMRLHLYNVVYSRNNKWYKATSAEMDEIEGWLRRAYPIPGLIVYRSETTMPESSIYTSGKDAKGNPTYYLDAGKVNDRLNLIRNINKVFGPGFREQDRYYGVATSASGDFMRGLGEVPGHVSAGPTGPKNTSSWQWEQDSVYYGDWYAGHEIGHTWGRAHPAANGYVSETNKGCGQSRDDFSYPYANAVIGGNSLYLWLGGNIWITFPPSRYYGFDVGLHKPVIRGPDWTDVMTYCQNEWTSDYTYNGIRARMQAEGFAVTAAQAMAPAGDFLLIQGQIAPDGNSATLGEILTLPAASQPLPDPGAYSLELRGSGGTLLASHSFTPTLYADEDTANDGIGFVNLVVPAASGTQTIELRRGETLLASRTVSAHAPTATLLTPNGGENIGPTGVTVSWQMTDEDGDPLTAALLFSPDNGANWQTLQTGITDTTSVDIPYSLLSGTEQGLMRVLVSDGVQTALDDSDAVFSVQRSAPEVAFLSPLPGSSFVVSQTVALAASAYDKEDGQLTDAAFAWTSDLDGPLGPGANLSLDTLSAGQHAVSVTATDSDGLSATITRTIAISQDVTSAVNLLVVMPQTVQLVAVVGTTHPVTGTLAIRDANASTGVTPPLNWTVSDDAAWLSLAVSAGTAPSDLSVSADPTGFATGIYTGTVTVQAGATVADVAVSLNVTPPSYSIFVPAIQR